MFECVKIFCLPRLQYLRKPRTLYALMCALVIPQYFLQVGVLQTIVWRYLLKSLSMNPLHLMNHFSSPDSTAIFRGNAPLPHRIVGLTFSQWLWLKVSCSMS